MEDNIKIIEFEDRYKDGVISFLKNIAINEFGYTDWEDYFNNMTFNKYKEDGSIFYIVLNNDGKVIGTGGMLKLSSISNEARLNSLYIDKGYRRKGISKEIFTRLMSFAKDKGYSSVSLHTFNKFNIAIDFYERNGFEMYEKDEESMYYRKSLK